MDDMGNTSIHFDFASTTIKNISPFKGPAKSTWILCHGWLGQIQGLLTMIGLLHRFLRQLAQSRTVCSTSWSKPDYQSFNLARDFMDTIPRWFKCNSDKAGTWYLAGITTLDPQSRPLRNYWISALETISKFWLHPSSEFLTFVHSLHLAKDTSHFLGGFCPLPFRHYKIGLEGKI